MEQTISTQVARHLLKIGAVKLSPSAPFTWASGWKSPIYCDNRKTLSFPEVRNAICDGFVEIIRSQFAQADVIAGVATGAIAHGMLVADRLGLPFIYVRSAAKGHGLENLIEGDLRPGQKVAVIEDLISTGGSSLKAVAELRKAGADVLGMAAIFTYGFDAAVENFSKDNVKLHTISNYTSLIEESIELNIVNSGQIATLEQWRKNPALWDAKI